MISTDIYETQELVKYMFLETYLALGATSNNNYVDQTENTHILYKYL